MLCPKCKSEILDNSKFWPECGSNISAISANSAAEKDLSIGAYRTVSTPVPEIDKSVGGIRTVTGMGLVAEAASPSVRIIKDRYELQEEIGRGGFSVVYKGLDKKLNRVIAVKVLSPQAGIGNTSVERFQRESSIIASLNHRNILAVYDCDRDNETGYFIVMECIEGGTLRDYLKEKGKLAIQDAVSLMRGICKGMSYAHRKNLVHRDLKPANIMLTSDGDEIVPKIVDFGLARSGGGSEVSISGYGMGTPFYMPPEQRRDAKSVNHTADIYALGKVFYEMLTGDIPDNVDPDKIPAESSGLSQIIFRCVKTKAEERYFSVDDLLADIDKFMSSTRPEVSVEKPPGIGVNVCPQCSTSNRDELKFCAKCGTGLTRQCPECDAESSIHDKHCPSCGTDIELFLITSSAFQKMEQYATENKWSRVIKESSLLPENTVLKGKKGTEIIDKIKSIYEDAEVKQNRTKYLNSEIKSLIKKNDFKTALTLIDELLGITEDVSSIKELKVSTLSDELLYRNDLYLKNIDSGLYHEALREGKRILEIIPLLKGEKIEGIEEIQESVSGLEQKLDLLAKSRRSVRFMHFIKAARLIKELRKYPELKNEAIRLKRGNLLRIYATLLVSCITIFFVFTNIYLPYHNKQLFNSAINEANTAMQEIRFEDAENAFKKALLVKGHEKDSVAIASLQKAQDNIKAEIQKRELQKNKNDYDLAMAEGSKAISAEKWAEAESAFNKALAVKGYENDLPAQNGIKSVQKAIELKKNKDNAKAAFEEAAKKVMQTFLPVIQDEDKAASERWNACDDAMALLNSIDKSYNVYLVAADLAELSNLKSKLAGIRSAQKEMELKKNKDAAKVTFEETIKKVTQTFLPVIQNESKPVSERCNACNEALALLNSTEKSYSTHLSAADQNEVSNLKTKITTLVSKLPVQIPTGFEMVKEPAADTNGLPQEIRHKTTGIEMVYVAPGEFVMGCPANEAYRGNNETQHRVKLSKGYYIGKYEVTQKQYENVMGSNPSYFKASGKDAPVENVSWDDNQAFCKKLGSGFRLPTEAEWEYAARGGNRSKGFIYSGSNNLDEVAWYVKNSGAKTQSVGQKKANELGIYDMSGNVWEWCSDWYGNYPSGSVTDPTGTPTGSNRVLRGGSWGDGGGYCRTARRGCFGPGARGRNSGIRVVFSVR